MPNDQACHSCDTCLCNVYSCSPPPNLWQLGLRLTGLFLASMAQLTACATVLNVLGLLANVTDECVGVHNGIRICETCRAQEVGCMSGQLVRDTLQDCALIVLVADGDSSSCKFLAFVSETGEECLDISALGAVHQEECVLEVVLGVSALGREFLGDFLPMLLNSSEVTDLHSSGVRQTLGQEIMSDLILVVPLVHGFSFRVGGVSFVLRHRTRLGSVEVQPVTSGLHSLLELHGEDGPVDTIGLKARDVGRKLFNGGRGGRHGRSSSR